MEDIKAFFKNPGAKKQQKVSFDGSEEHDMANRK
jgi:hypothetical protein